MQKPKTKEDLLPPFQQIGNAGWDVWLRGLIAGYNLSSEIDLPEPTPNQEIVQREIALAVPLPDNLKLFLQTFGPLRFETLRVLPPEEIDFLSHFAIKVDLTPQQKAQSTKMIVVAEEQMDESDLVDLYGLELATGKIYRCSNFYDVLFEYLPSFDNLIKMSAIDLSWGFFGWGEDHIEEWANQIAKEDLGLLEMTL